MVEEALDELLKKHNITKSKHSHITIAVTSNLSQTKHPGVLRMRRNQTDPSIQCFRGPSRRTTFILLFCVLKVGGFCEF